MKNKTQAVGKTTTDDCIGVTEMQELRIQTFIQGKGWVNCEHKNWFELIEDGWEFGYLDLDGCVVMTRDGYINKFRNFLEEVEN